MSQSTNSKGRKEAISFFRFVQWSIRKGICVPAHYTASDSAESSGQSGKDQLKNSGTEKAAGRQQSSPGKIVILTDNVKRKNDSLSEMTAMFMQLSPYACEVIDLTGLGMKGGFVKKRI